MVFAAGSHADRAGSTRPAHSFRECPPDEKTTHLPLLLHDECWFSLITSEITCMFQALGKHTADCDTDGQFSGTAANSKRLLRVTPL